QMATGRLPFEGDQAIVVMMAHANQPPPNPRDMNPQVSAAYQEVILKCLAKSPADRWQSMAEVGRAVAAALQGRPLMLTPPRASPTVTAPYTFEDAPVSTRSDVKTLPATNASTPIVGQQPVRRQA